MIEIMKNREKIEKIVENRPKMAKNRDFSGFFQNPKGVPLGFSIFALWAEHLTAFFCYFSKKNPDFRISGENSEKSRNFDKFR